MEEQASEVDPLDPPLDPPEPPDPSGAVVAPPEVVVGAGVGAFIFLIQIPESFGHFSAPSTPLPQKANRQPAKGRWFSALLKTVPHARAPASSFVG